MTYEHAVEFVRSFFESHDPIGAELAVRYPFRRRFEHCLRCSIWARRIALSEGADVGIAETSALFHDIGKAIAARAQNHGEVGAQICDEYLSSVGCDKSKRAHIVQIVLRHSKHEYDRDASLEARVVSDADLLDETGAIMILWDAMACAGDDGPSYDKAFDRIMRAHTRLKVELPNRLFTPTAGQILKGRLLLVDTFLKNLIYELGRSENPS